MQTPPPPPEGGVRQNHPNFFLTDFTKKYDFFISFREKKFFFTFFHLSLVYFIKTNVEDRKKKIYENRGVLLGDLRYILSKSSIKRLNSKKIDFENLENRNSNPPPPLGGGVGVLNIGPPQSSRYRGGIK